MDFSCAQSMWTYNEAAIELAAAVFGKRLQEHQTMNFVTKLNSWRRKHSKIRLDSFLYLSGFTAKINTTVCCSSRLFSTDLGPLHMSPVDRAGSVTGMNFALGSYEKFQPGFRDEKRSKILGTSSGAKFRKQSKQSETQKF